jgi:WD40 repeat protein
MTLTPPALLSNWLRYICRCTLVLSQTIVAPLFLAAQPREPASKQSADQKPPVHIDRYGDPLPEGAIARIGTLRFRQTYIPSSLVFSTDGNLIFTACDGYPRISCWETATGKLAREITCGQWGAHWVTMSPDGKTLAGVSDGRESSWLLDTATGKPIHQMECTEDGVTHIAAAFSPDGKTLASCGAGVFSFGT